MVTPIKHPAGARFSLEGGESGRGTSVILPRLGVGISRLRVGAALSLPIVAIVATRDASATRATIAVICAIGLAVGMTATSGWWAGSVNVRATAELVVDSAAAVFVTVILGDVGGHASWLIVSLPILEAAARLPERRPALVVAAAVGVGVACLDMVGVGSTGVASDLASAATWFAVVGLIVLVTTTVLTDARFESRLAVHAGVESDRRARILGAVAAAGCRLDSNDTASLVEVVVDLGHRLGSTRVAALEHVGGSAWAAVGAASGPVFASDRAVAEMVRAQGSTLQTNIGSLVNAPTGQDPDEIIVALPVTDDIVVVVTGPDMPGGLVIEAMEIVAEQAGFAIDRARALAEAEAQRQELVRRVGQDDMTGLVNRTRFAELLAEKATSSEFTALLYIDLDRFKTVNDRFGHEAGDRLLVAVAKRLESVIRPGDVAARHGGDEFTVLLGAIASVRDVEAVANRVIGALSQAFVIDDNVCRIGASIGAAVARTPEEIDGLIDRADAAMYQAKRAGGDTVAIDHR